MANGFDVKKASDNSNDGFNETVEYHVMHQANVENNNNKFYCIELQKNPLGNYRIFTHYGRLGISNIYEIRDVYNGQPIIDLDIVKKEFEGIHKKKLKGKRNPETGEMDAYTEIEVVSSSVGSENIHNKSNLTKTVTVKKATIDTSSYAPQVSSLLDQLISENIHAITTNSSVTYSVNGGFSTPLGPVTKSHCDKAKVYLDQLNKEMSEKGLIDVEKPDIKKIHSMYYSLIPHEFSRKISVDDMISDANKLQKEYDLIDQLSTAVTIGSAMAGNTSQRISALGTDIELLNDLSDVQRIKKYIRNSKASNHRNEDVWNFDVKTIYKVRIPEERNRFEGYGRNLDNIKELMHGSSNSNALSILHKGLIIPPSNAGHVTGRLYSDGVYFSDMSTKSLRYSLGYWGAKRSRNNNAFLFLANVALGKTFVTNSTHYPYRGAKEGFDSTSALAGGGLYNNEYIVYRLNQQSITYLVEMTLYGK